MTRASFILHLCLVDVACICAFSFLCYKENPAFNITIILHPHDISLLFECKPYKNSYSAAACTL